MRYIVYYTDDEHKQHMTFVKSFKEVEFIKERFGEVTIETYVEEHAVTYIVYYTDDEHKQHMTFVKSFKEVEFLRDRFGEVIVETYKIE